jgi:hypothetical protein
MLLRSLYSILSDTVCLSLVPENMAPSVATEPVRGNETQSPLKVASRTNHKEPLKVSGALPSNYFEVTSIIGREYPDVQISELMTSPRRDEYIRDLAITGTCGRNPWQHLKSCLAP